MHASSVVVSERGLTQPGTAGETVLVRVVRNALANLGWGPAVPAGTLPPEQPRDGVLLSELHDLVDRRFTHLAPYTRNQLKTFHAELDPFRFHRTQRRRMPDADWDHVWADLDTRARSLAEAYAQVAASHPFETVSALPDDLGKHQSARRTGMRVVTLGQLLVWLPRVRPDLKSRLGFPEDVLELGPNRYVMDLFGSQTFKSLMGFDGIPKHYWPAAAHYIIEAVKERYPEGTTGIDSFVE